MTLSEIWICEKLLGRVRKSLTSLNRSVFMEQGRTAETENTAGVRSFHGAWAISILYWAQSQNIKSPERHEVKPPAWDVKHTCVSVCECVRVNESLHPVTFLSCSVSIWDPTVSSSLWQKEREEVRLTNTTDTFTKAGSVGLEQCWYIPPVCVPTDLSVSVTPLVLLLLCSF